jgi:hypothetical protein
MGAVRCSERVSSKSSWHIDVGTASLDVTGLPARSLSSASSPPIPIAASACHCAAPCSALLHDCHCIPSVRCQRPLASLRCDTRAHWHFPTPSYRRVCGCFPPAKVPPSRPLRLCVVTALAARSPDPPKQSLLHVALVNEPIDTARSFLPLS